MPLYDYVCPECDHMEEMLTPMEHIQACPVCRQNMVRQMSAPNFNMGPAGAYGYFDETLGKYIPTNAAWREECRRQNVTPKGDTPKVSHEDM